MKQACSINTRSFSVSLLSTHQCFYDVLRSYVHGVVFELFFTFLFSCIVSFHTQSKISQKHLLTVFLSDCPVLK